MPKASIAASGRYFTRFSGSKAGLLRSFWQERADGFDLVRQMRVLTVIKSEKIARGPFQSGPALVHTARTQGHLPGSPSQEASGRDRSAPSGVGQIRFGVGFLQGVQWFIAGWSSPVARQAHNLKVTGSNPVPATKLMKNPSNLKGLLGFCFGDGIEPNNINDLACRFKSPRNHTRNRISARNLADSRKFSASIFHRRGQAAASRSGVIMLVRSM